MEQRLLITYSPKYAAYQKEIREKQIERAKAMLSNGRHKKNRKIRMTQQDLLIKQLLQKMEKWPISYIFWMKKDCTGSTVRWPLCCMYGSF